VGSVIGFPTFSAGTYVSRAAVPDLYGAEVGDPPLARVTCPIFACYGSDEPGGDAELELIRRNARGAARVQTRVFEGADHGYEGREQDVAAALFEWVSRLKPPRD
jgi:hypothetical protein